MPGPLHITVRPEPDALVVSLRGDLDIGTVDLLEDCLAQIDGRVRRVVLDLQDLDFVDSSGLNLIVHTHRRFGPDLRELVLANPRPDARRVLEVSGVDHVVPVIATAAAPAVAEPA